MIKMSSKSIPVKLPDELIHEIDELIAEGKFLSRSDLLRYGARLIVGVERRRLPLHTLAEEYAYKEIVSKLERTRDEA
ncbi:MAG: ribbon-helix-helix domain-containing protein [Methanocellales archaeon]|nr:ribbon-helix-helix domain-containing protein [Methanocellales archaeon]